MSEYSALPATLSTRHLTILNIFDGNCGHIISRFVRAHVES